MQKVRVNTLSTPNLYVATLIQNINYFDYEFSKVVVLSVSDNRTY